MKITDTACTSKERCIEILTEEIEDHLPVEKHEDYERAVNRVLYEFRKTDEVKPKFHKGAHTKDWYTCGNCCHTISSIGDNFCPNCGYKIKWDSTRCLTK